MRVTIESKGWVDCRCECGNEGRVADLCAALHWAWCEILRHGPGSEIEIVVDLTFVARSEKPSGLGIP